MKAMVFPSGETEGDVSIHGVSLIRSSSPFLAFHSQRPLDPSRVEAHTSESPPGDHAGASLNEGSGATAVGFEPSLSTIMMSRFAPGRSIEKEIRERRSGTGAPRREDAEI